MFRIIRKEPAGPPDFVSYRALGKADARRSGVDRDEDDGVSLLATKKVARRYAEQFRFGKVLAELSIPSDAPIDLEPPDRNGHVNGYGDPEAFTGYVVRYHDVD